MSNPVVGQLLPSQRMLLARAHEDIAAVYREAGMPESARINAMIAAGFRKAVDEPMINFKERTDGN